MELINNRYKILNCTEKEHHFDQYIALDLLKKGRKVILYLIQDTAATKPLTEYCNNKFYEISSYKQNNIIIAHSYGIVETVDGKQATDRTFFYTTEYMETINLTDLDQPLKEDEILDIYIQLARALDFLHYRGITYKYIGAETVKIAKHNGRYTVKLLDIVSVYRMEVLKTYFHPLTYSCIAPEVERGAGIGTYTDIYSLGALMHYLLTLKRFHYNTLDIAIKDYTSYKYGSIEYKLLRIIQKMTNPDIDTRYETIHKCNRAIKETYKLNEPIENIDDMDKINFKIPIIGRERELKQILNTYQITEGKIKEFNKDLVLINGDEGIGKTRLLHEVNNLMKWKECKTFFISIGQQEERFKLAARSLLRQFIKVASDESVQKYGNELVKLVPELATEKSIVPSKTLPERQEQLRLYDRIANFILDVSLSSANIILIDDFHLADKFMAKFIDYLVNLNRTRKVPLLIILAYRDDQYYYSKSKDYINKWALNKALNIKLSRLTIEETAKMIKHILGWREELLIYASKIMADTEGVPGYVEYIMKELYSQNFLKVEYMERYKGFAPKINIDNYDKIILSHNIDRQMIKLIQSLDTTTKEILKAVSLFNTAMSKETIIKMLQEEENSQDNRFTNLIQLNILCEKFDDWGYTYGFCNSSFKKYVYSKIEDEKRVSLHIRASNILEELYTKEGRENKDELIYQFIQSNQKDKAIDYCIQSGINMLKLFVYGQSYSFFKRAYELLTSELDSRKLTVVLYLAKVSQRLLKNDEAIHYFEYAIKLADLQNSYVKLVDAKNKIAVMYLTRGEFDLSKNYLGKSLDRAVKANYIEGIMEAAYSLTKVYKQTREYDQMKIIAEKYFNYASKQGNLYYIGIFMVQRGLVEYHNGNTVIALQLLRESIKYLEEADRPEKASEPINNIGIIYNEYFQDTSNARLYFEKALKISEHSHKIDDIINFNNNIAESYIIDHSYYEAIDILKKNLELAHDYGDEISILSMYTSLIKGYTNIGEYKQAYTYLLKGMDICKNKKHNYRGMCLEAFAEVCINFYIAVGAQGRALTLIEDFFKRFPNSADSIRLRMEKLYYFTRCYVKCSVEDEKFTQLAKAYSTTSFVRDRRMFLLDGALHYINRSMPTRAKQLLNEDRSLISSINNDYFILRRKYIESFLLTEEKQILALEDLFLNKGLERFKEIQWQIYAQLGNLQLRKGQFYKAVNSFLDALSVVYVLFNKVPSQFQNAYLLRDNKIQIRDNLLSMEDLINNKQVDKTGDELYAYCCGRYGKEFLDSEDVEQFFRLLESQNILRNKKFYELALENYDKVNKTKITDLKKLLQSLTHDNIINLNFLLQLACRTTLATSGAIIIAGDDKYETLTTVGQDVQTEKISEILDNVSNTNREVIIKNNLDMIKGLAQDTRASITLPIYKEYGDTDFSHIEINQRKGHRDLGKKIIGFLHLETNKALNNFSEETLSMCKTLMPLAGVLVTNYNLNIFSSIDKLTGTYVRKYFEQIFDEELQDAKLNEYYLSVIMLDIDHFKNINDTYGHQKGDTVLAETGKIIKNSIRSTDHVGRYGGEEFIVLLPNANKDDAYKIAEKIRKKIENSNLIGGDAKLTISGGIATYPQDGSQQGEIIEKADQALYMAKESGRNQNVKWQQGIDLKNKRVDKLAGIVTGNIVEDQRNVLVITEIIELISSSITLEEKVYATLGRLSEILEAEASILFTVANGRIHKEYYRKRFVEGWADPFTFNEKIVENAIETRQGKYTIDWEHISSFDPLTNTPSWRSVIAVPIVVNDRICGVIYLSTPIKEKEFDYNAYNLVKITSNIIGAILKIKD